jgi:hypothetical protein
MEDDKDKIQHIIITIWLDSINKTSIQNELWDNFGQHEPLQKTARLDSWKGQHSHVILIVEFVLNWCFIDTV